MTYIEVNLVPSGSGNPKSYLFENGTDFGCSGGQVSSDREKDRQDDAVISAQGCQLDAGVNSQCILPLP